MNPPQAREEYAMGLMINSNIPALGADRQTERANRLLNNTLRQMASGLRINRAADDAAGLAIAERFRMRIRQGQVEINNLQSGINYAQTAEGGLSAQMDAAQRIRELAAQAANGTLNDEQRAALNAEAQQLVQQIGDTAANTEFNGQNMLQAGATVPVGTEGDLQVNVAASTPAALGIDTVDLSTREGALAALGAVDAAINAIGENRAALGAQMNRFESAITQRQIGVENAAAAESAIRDIDIAQATMNRTRAQILAQGGLAALIQSNVAPQNVLSLLRG